MARSNLEELACAHTALRKAARQLDIVYDQALAPTGLKMTQVFLLSRIDVLKAPTLRALAADSGARISALTHALHPLVRDGLVQVRTDDDDRRIKHAELTPSGRKLLRQGFALWQVVNRRVESVLGSEAARQMLALADQVSSKDFLHRYDEASVVPTSDSLHVP